jgi:hypothetical protein
MGWAVAQGPRGTVLKTPQFDAFAAVTAPAWLISPPARFAGDTAAPLQMTFASPALIAWFENLEQWVAARFPAQRGKDWKSCVKKSAFNEKYLRGKLNDSTRFFDQNDRMVSQLPLTRGSNLLLILSLSLYQVSGIRGISVMVLGIKFAPEPIPTTTN